MQRIIDKKSVFKIIALVCGFVILPVSGIPAQEYSRLLRLDIQLERYEFLAGEPLRGKVIVDSRIPVIHPVTFVVKIYKDGKLLHHNFTNIPKIFLGKTEYDLKIFGLSGINAGPGAVGLWQIVITQQADDQVRAEAAFSILK